MSLWKVSNPLYGEDFPARWVEAPNESMALLQAPTPGYSLRTLTDMGWRAEPFEARPSGEHADLVSTTPTETGIVPRSVTPR